MAKKGFLKVAVFVLLFVGVAASASAQVTISAGFALSSASAKYESDYLDASIKGDTGFGGNIYFDYLLPIGVPLSLGFEVGYDTASLSEDQSEIKANVVPLLLRVAYHFDLMPKLDLYGVGKIGYALGSAEWGSGENEDGYNGFGFGIDAGVAYYFTSNFGIFAEAGFDRYNLSQDFSENGYNWTISAPFNRFLTVGISTKF
jgi:opacity protein-like surface antigen